MFAFLRKFREKHAAVAEVLRYLAVGLVAKIVNWGAMALVLYLFQPQLYPNVWSLFFTTPAEVTKAASLTATAVGFTLGTVAEFVLSVLFVFGRGQRGGTSLGFVAYVLLSLGGLGIHELGMLVGHGLWNISPWLVNVVVGFFVVAYNYVAKKLLLFNKKQCAAEGDGEAASDKK